jgi:asparagine synthase (glutamine-hydrolysing)
MCGFIGYIGKIDNNKEVLSNMLSNISHRGPDSEDSYSDDSISLGFRRLSIIDLQGGSQPIYNEDRTKVLVFNGEIYNFQVLREDLLKKGHKFYTHTDSEVLIHGYEEYGKDLLMKLRGMFSFVIWDSVNKKLFGARDFFGIKPLYYYKSGNTFLFGSEIKGFLPHPGFKKEFNDNKLPDYLTFSCIPGQDTFFKNVYKLLPGHYFESSSVFDILSAK